MAWHGVRIIVSAVACIALNVCDVSLLREDNQEFITCLNSTHSVSHSFARLRVNARGWHRRSTIHKYFVWIIVIYLSTFSIRHHRRLECSSKIKNNNFLNDAIMWFCRHEGEVNGKSCISLLPSVCFSSFSFEPRNGWHFALFRRNEFRMETGPEIQDPHMTLARNNFPY